MSGVEMSMPSLVPGLYMDTSYHETYPVDMKITDGLPEELLSIVNEHWFNFPPANPLIAHFVGVMYFIMTCVNFFANGLVIYIFLKVKSLRTSSNIFVINLALSDFCMMLTQGPVIFINTFMQRYWAFGTLMCKLYGFFGAVFGLGSILTMVVIGYDRYNVIVKGITGTKITPSKAILMLIGLWTYSTVVTLCAFLDLWGSFAAEGLLITCSYNYMAEDWNNRSFVTFAFFWNYCIPMSLVIFFYSSIVKAVWSHETALKAQAKKMNVDSLRSNPNNSAESAEVRIAKVAVTNVCLWIAIWSPYTCVVLTSILGAKQYITPLIAQIPSFLTKLASCVNPIVYAMSHPKYREALMIEVPWLGINEPTAAGKTNNGTAVTSA